MERERLGDWVKSGIPGMLSVVIPAYNEEDCLAETVASLAEAFVTAGLNHEILVVNDNSTDATEAVLKALSETYPAVRYVNNGPPHGFGCAVRVGIENFAGEAVAIVMADGSDPPEDVIKFWRKLQEGYDCVFGSRFVRGAKVEGYPLHKMVLNRVGNTFIRLLFRLRYNDITNAFKLYRREAIAGAFPIISEHFNLTVELPLKAIVRGYRMRWCPTLTAIATWASPSSGSEKWVAAIFS